MPFVVVEIAVCAAVLAVLHRRRAAYGPVALVIALLGFTLFWALFAHFHIDDAGISYAYARNLAAGAGPRAFPGAPAVEGYSNPLWTLLLTAGEFVGLPAALASKALVLLGGLATLVLVRRAVLASGGGELEAAFTVLVVGANASFVIWSTAGLENALLAALLIGAAVVSLESRPSSALGLIAGLMDISRPEGAALAIAAIVGDCLAASGARWRRAVVATCIALALGALYQLWRVHAFHAWLPNTYYSKVQSGFGLRWPLGWIYVKAAFGEAGGPGLLIGLVGTHLARRHRAACVVLLPVGAGAAFAAWSGGDWMPNARFVSHLVPLAAVALVPGLFALARWAGERAPRLRVPAGALAVAVCVLTALGQMPLIAENHRRGVCSLASIRAQGAAFVDIGPALCGEARPSVATPDIGGVLLASADVRVVDLAGLIEADARGPLRAPGYWPRRLARDRPQLVFVHGPWVPTTGLTDGALGRSGYRLVCRVAVPTEGIERVFSPSLYVRSDCTRRPSARAVAALRSFCSGHP